MLDRVPGLRDKVGSTIDWDVLDKHLPDIAEGLDLSQSLGPDAEVAISALRRDAMLAQASPFTCPPSAPMAQI
jgi:hypothetical protein